MEIKDFLTEVLGKTYKMPADKVAALFNADGTIADNAKDSLYAAHQAIVQEFESREKVAQDNGYKKAQSEILDMKEKEIKQEFGLNGSKSRGLLEIVKEIAAQATSKGSTIDADKIKLHPEYIKLQDDSKAAMEKIAKEWEEKYNNREAEITGEKTFTEISKKADAYLSGFGLPEDEKLSAKQKSWLYNELKQYKFTPNGDDYVITGPDGKVVNDNLGHRKNFETLVNELAAGYWPKKDGKERSGSGAQNNQGGAGAAKVNPWKGKVTDDVTYSNAIKNAKTAEERIEITDAYEEHQSVAK